MLNDRMHICRRNLSNRWVIERYRTQSFGSRTQSNKALYECSIAFNFRTHNRRQSNNFKIT